MTEDNKIVPVSSFGMKVMSIGFMVEENSAIIWRGPMLFKAMDQFFRDVQWGELDYLVIDLPPGTGDVTLTMAQKVPVSGGIVVCTPQNIALSDCKKAIDMFERVNVPILGVVENMAGYQTPSGEIVPLFPQGQLRHYLEIKKIPLLGSLAFDPEIGLACEAGLPFVQSNPESIFRELAGKALELVQN
jgi:ATP-binding protein involved in chromosome partitioning